VFATAARIGVPFEGTPADRRLVTSVQCGFDQAAEGRPLLASAVTLGSEIKSGTV
jgi:hypothetical protein